MEIPLADCSLQEACCFFAAALLSPGNRAIPCHFCVYFMQLLSLAFNRLGLDLRRGKKEGESKASRLLRVTQPQHAACAFTGQCAVLALQDATRENLKVLGSLRMAAASLAHKLDAATLLAQIVNHLKGPTPCPTALPRLSRTSSTAN